MTEISHMAFLQRLRAASAAEDFFAVLDVPYDPAVLNVARLHILRRMRRYLDEGGQDGEMSLARCRETLARAYEDFLRSSPIAERSFKVHRDAVAPVRRSLIGLEDLTQEDALSDSSEIGTDLAGHRS